MEGPPSWLLKDRPHDSQRHEMTTVIARLQTFQSQCDRSMPLRHRSREFIRFLNYLDSRRLRGSRRP
jgi:hypothetical protein